jgi:RimJ/RimL family protein N-acetyltransferase
MTCDQQRENEFNIERLTKSDTDGLKMRSAAIAALAGEIWREHYTPIIGAAQVEYMLDKFQSARQIYTDIAQNGYVYFTANNRDGELIGYCGVVPAEKYLLLSKCYVHILSRGHGIARSFIHEAEALCEAEYGLSKIRLTVNKYNAGSIAFYNKMGFKTVDSVNAEIGGGFYMDDYIMERELRRDG